MEKISDITAKRLHFDVYRTIVLGHYFRYWGMAEYRKVVTRRDNGSVFEIYTFPSSEQKHVYHVATVGLAEQVKPDGSREGHEYFMTLDGELGGAELEWVFDYVADLCAHSISNLEHATPPRVLGPSPLAPAAWPTKALLIDEPRGEAEGFYHVQVDDSIDVAFLWLVPLHESEYRFILEHGFDAFDVLEEDSAYSIADVSRKPFTEH